MKRLLAADLFCGAGGTSTGVSQAAASLGLRAEILAINHWPVAVETHTTNHPGARHLCANLEAVDPASVIPGGRLNLLVASPECLHHSRARGGKPMSDQSRASAWHVLRWAEALYVENILIENVREFEEWGPLGVSGRPIRSKKGQTFRAFCDSLRSLGYRVEHRVLNAADYGDPTTRQRLFILARRGNRRIAWPEATHAPRGDATLFGERAPWRTAREVIDWTIRSRSIFGRKKPLAPKTLARIEEGLRRFGGAAAEPFLAILRGTGIVRSLDEPLPALTAGGEHLALVEPFVVTMEHGGGVRSVDKPLPTITCARGGAFGVCEPFLVPFHAEREGQAPRIHSVDEPLPVVAASPTLGLCEPFVLSQASGGAPRSVEDPLPTIVGDGAVALVEPFITKAYSSGGQWSRVSDPVPTVTTKDRFGLVEPESDGVRLDIRFRMLAPHELAAAMGFPADYKFTGNRGDIVRQIGNAVPVNLARALARSLMEPAA